MQRIIKDLTHQTMNLIDHYQLANKQVIVSIKEELGRIIMKKVYVLGPKMYSYLTAMLIKGQSV